MGTQHGVGQVTACPRSRKDYLRGPLYTDYAGAPALIMPPFHPKGRFSTAAVHLNPTRARNNTAPFHWNLP